MKAWLITWDWIGDHAAVDNLLVAIFTSRRTDKWVAEFLEQFYLAFSCTARDMAYYANRKKKIPYKANTPMIINDIPHGNRITCGDNPWLYARVVRDLNIKSDIDEDYEIISWKEPPIFKWKNERRIDIVVQREGMVKTIKRKQNALLNCFNRVFLD